MATVKFIVYGLFLLVGLGLIYMLFHNELSNTAMILVVCLGFTAGMMFILYKISHADLTSTDSKASGDQIDRTMFKAYRAEELSETCKRLDMKAAPPSGVLSVCQYLREIVRTDSIAAIEIAELGCLQKCIQALLSGSLEPKAALACIELINELLTNKQAKVKLIRHIEGLFEVMDALLHWTALLVASTILTLQLPADTIQLSNVLLTNGCDINQLATSSTAVVFSVGENIANKIELLVAILGKTLVCIGLVCSEECPDAQTRLNDRGGAKVLLGALNMALLMCSTTISSSGIGAVNKNNNPGGVQSVSVGLRRKLSAVVCKWACWCLFNLSLEHPPSKAAIFEASGIRLAIDALKLHSDSAAIHRQALALLFSTVSPDHRAKHSLAQARNMMMANGVIEVVEHAKVAFRKENDIYTTCRAISNTLMIDYS